MSASTPGSPVVLVVEDDALVRAMLVDVLAEEGFHVLEAGDGAQALAQLAARPEIAAVVTDVEMPGGLDGFALARRIRRERPRLGVVVSSGRLAPGPGGLPAGVRYLPKPLSAAGLVAAVRGVMEPPRVRPGVLPASLLMDDPSTLPHAPMSEIRPSLDPEE